MASLPAASSSIAPLVRGALGRRPGDTARGKEGSGGEGGVEGKRGRKGKEKEGLPEAVLMEASASRSPRGGGHKGAREGQ